jgi:hypothetical protein
MGNCDYCGQPAGLFRSVHKECAARRDQARNDIDLAFQKVMLIAQPPAPPTFRAIIEKLGNDAQLTPQELRARVLSGLVIALDAALADFDLSENEIGRFNTIVDAFGLDESAFDEAGIRQKLVQALVLKDLSEGRPSTRVQLSTSLPIALKRGETIQWLFNAVTLRQPRTSYHYEGGSHGVSIRLMKGVSYRVGSHRGQRVSTTEVVTIGSGALAVSTTAVYFMGGANSKKTALSGIVSVDAFDDGVVVTPSRGKQQLYLMSDSMFAANLILKSAAL